QRLAGDEALAHRLQGQRPLRAGERATGLDVQALGPAAQLAAGALLGRGATREEVDLELAVQLAAAGLLPGPVLLHEHRFLPHHGALLDPAVGPEAVADLDVQALTLEPLREIAPRERFARLGEERRVALGGALERALLRARSVSRRPIERRLPP